MKQYKFNLKTRGGNCRHYINASSREEAIEKAKIKWKESAFEIAGDKK